MDRGDGSHSLLTFLGRNGSQIRYGICGIQEVARPFSGGKSSTFPARIYHRNLRQHGHRLSPTFFAQQSIMCVTSTLIYSCDHEKKTEARCFNDCTDPQTTTTHKTQDCDSCLAKKKGKKYPGPYDPSKQKAAA